MAENLLLYTGGIAETNSYAFSTPGGWIGVDATEGFREFLDGQEVRLGALLLTHAHFDHVNDAAALAERHGCEVFAFAPPSAALTLEDWVARTWGMRLVVDHYRVDHVLEGRVALEVLGESFALAHVPGHSPDSVVFFHEATQRLFSGDTLMDSSIGRTDFPGGGLDLLLSGIREKILGLPDSVEICPGHGRRVPLGEARRWFLDTFGPSN